MRLCVFPHSVCISNFLSHTIVEANAILQALAFLLLMPKSATWEPIAHIGAVVQRGDHIAIWCGDNSGPFFHHGIYADHVQVLHLLKGYGTHPGGVCGNSHHVAIITYESDTHDARTKAIKAARDFVKNPGRLGMYTVGRNN